MFLLNSNLSKLWTKNTEHLMSTSSSVLKTFASRVSDSCFYPVCQAQGGLGNFNDKMQTGITE